MTASNGYQLAARIAKAQKLADLLAANSYQSHTVAGFGEAQWSLACAAARIKSGKASEETRALVVKALREREKAARMTVDFGPKLIEDSKVEERA